MSSCKGWLSTALGARHGKGRTLAQVGVLAPVNRTEGEGLPGPLVPKRGPTFPTDGPGSTICGAGVSRRSIPPSKDGKGPDFYLVGCFYLSARCGTESFGVPVQGGFFSRENKIKTKTPQVTTSEAWFTCTVSTESTRCPQAETVGGFLLAEKLHRLGPLPPPPNPQINLGSFH